MCKHEHIEVLTKSYYDRDNGGWVEYEIVVCQDCGEEVKVEYVDTH